MLTRMLVVVALVAIGCKGKETTNVEPAPKPAAVGSGSQAAPPAFTAEDAAADIDALQTEFDALVEADEDIAATRVGAKLIAALRAQKPDTREMADALTSYGMELHAAGDYHLARKILEEAIAHPVTKKEREVLSEVTYQLGSLYADIDMLDEGIELLQQSLALSIELNGKGSIEATVTKESLAGVLSYAKRYDEAGAIYREVLTEFEAAKDKGRIGRALMNLGSNSEDLEQSGEAIKYYLRAIPILTTVKGYDRGPLAEVHAGLGRLFRAENKLDKAVSQFRQALAVHTEVLGPDHPNLASAYHELAITLDMKGDNKGARAACGKALEIRQAKLAVDHTDRKLTVDLCASLASGE